MPRRTTNSKSTVTLTKMLARNTDINRALKAGEDYVKLLPTPLQADPPKLEFYQIEDVRAKRGGVAEVREHACLMSLNLHSALIRVPTRSDALGFQPWPRGRERQGHAERRGRRCGSTRIGGRTLSCHESRKRYA